MSRSFSSLSTKLRVARDLAAQPDLPVTLEVLVPLLVEAGDAFAAADDAVRKAVAVWQKEAPEAAAAMATLAALYDGAREVVRVHLPGVVDDGPASGHTTPQETLEAAESLADVFEDHASEQWAERLYPQLEAALGEAVREVDEKTRAGEAEQHARHDRADKAKVAWTEFRRFRRMVRRAYGASSRQYQSLRERRSGPDDAPALAEE